MMELPEGEKVCSCFYTVPERDRQTPWRTDGETDTRTVRIRVRHPQSPLL